MNLRTIAVIRRVEKNDLLTFVDQSHNARVKTLDSTIDGHNIILVIKILESFLVIFRNGFGVVEGTVSPHVLMVA